MLPRDNTWRQGLVLTFQSSCALGLCDKEQNAICVVISHDCDLQNDTEEEVDIMVGIKVTSVDSTLAFAKHVRKLHLQYMDSSNNPYIIELKQSSRRSVARNFFMEQAVHDTNLLLPSEEKRVLKQWLGARYARSAFPSEFENRLRRDKKFETKFTNILKPVEAYLVAVFFDLGAERFKELSLNEPYNLNISLVYNDKESKEKRIMAEDCALKLTNLFHTTFGKPTVATEIILESCSAVAGSYFSILDAQKADLFYRLNYLSLREKPQSDFISV